MKTSRILFTFSFFLLFVANSAFSFGKKDSSDTTTQDVPKTEEIKKDFLKIDFLLDTAHANPKNHLNWKTSSASYKDSFDAISGASKVHSTKNLREATLDASSKALQIPKGLRALCLFAVASPETLQKDNFQITHEEKKLTISFSHRGNDYKIESDENGTILVPEGFSIKLANQNEKPEEKPSEEEANFTQDKPAFTIKAIFSGKLKASLSPSGILTLNGKLILTENKEPEKPTEENLENSENSERAESSETTENI